LPRIYGTSIRRRGAPCHAAWDNVKIYGESIRPVRRVWGVISFRRGLLFQELFKLGFKMRNFVGMLLMLAAVLGGRRRLCQFDGLLGECLQSRRFLCEPLRLPSF